MRCHLRHLYLVNSIVLLKDVLEILFPMECYRHHPLQQSRRQENPAAHRTHLISEFFMRSSWYSRSRCSFSCSLFSRLRSKIKLWMAETRNVMLKQSNIVIDFHLSFLMRGNRPHLLYLQNHPQRGTCRQEVRRLQSSGDCSGRRQCPCCH